MPQKKKIETPQEHLLRLIREVLECPGPLCEHCQVIIQRELEPMLKIVKIELPEKNVIGSAGLNSSYSEQSQSSSP